ncbi:MAG TPA: sigma-70 family RNA polymerase sigma factor [Steroidobacteraceae bacterium]|jgi:RNA polymerase sigma-70 factor (ECF subfamily)
MQPAVASAAPDDGDVIALLRTEGRERAFALLLPRYEHKVYRLCCALLRDGSQAQDAAQESLVRIWKALPGYDGRASLSSWIYAITRNRCLTALERRRAQLAVSDDDAELDQQAAPEMESPEADERSAQLRELIDLLPERARRTLTLFYFEERSVSEVASQLGWPEGTVKTTLFRARAALTELMRRRGLDDPSLWLESGA